MKECLVRLYWYLDKWKECPLLHKDVISFVYLIANSSKTSTAFLDSSGHIMQKINSKKLF